MRDGRTAPQTENEERRGTGEGRRSDALHREDDIGSLTYHRNDLPA